MTRPLRIEREVLAERQGWRCIYCEFCMARDEAEAARMMFVEAPRFDLHPRVISRAIDGVQATFEHVVPRIEGGSNSIGNGFAACYFCNWLRGSSDILIHKMHIVALVAAHRHPRLLFRERGLWPAFDRPTYEATIEAVA